MRRRRSSDDDSVESAVCDRLLELRGNRDIRIASADPLEPALVAVDEPRDLGPRTVPEVPDEVRPPFAGTHDGNGNHERNPKPSRTTGRKIAHQSTIGRIFV